MDVITSLENKKIKQYSKLLLKKYREEQDLFLVEGEHLVEEAAKTNHLVEVFATEHVSTTYDVPTTYVSYDVIKKLSATQTPQNIIGVCRKKTEKEIGSRVLLLDDLQDPGNVGTIIRSCVAFGFDTLILSSNTVDLYNDKVIRASEGMLFHLNILKRAISPTIDELKQNGFTIYGTSVVDGKDIKSVTKQNKMAFVIGNEGAGVNQKILEKCDEMVYITMQKTCESLNAGVAASILMYEIEG